MSMFFLEMSYDEDDIQDIGNEERNEKNQTDMDIEISVNSGLRASNQSDVDDEADGESVSIGNPWAGPNGATSFSGEEIQMNRLPDVLHDAHLDTLEAISFEAYDLAARHLYFEAYDLVARHPYSGVNITTTIIVHLRWVKYPW